MIKIDWLKFIRERVWFGWHQNYSFVRKIDKKRIYYWTWEWGRTAVGSSLWNWMPSAYRTNILPWHRCWKWRSIVE